MNHLEINEDSNYILSDNVACMNVQYVNRLSDISVSDVVSNEIAKVRRITYQKKRYDSIVLIGYIGEGYIEYLTNTMYISWDKYRNGNWRLGGNNICLYLNNGGQQDIENILIIEAVYGINAGIDDSFGFEIFDDFGKSIFKINNNLVRAESLNDISNAQRPYSNIEDFVDANEFKFIMPNENNRLLAIQENFCHLSGLRDNDGTGYKYYAIRQTNATCELSIVKEGQGHYVGKSYGFGSASNYMKLNIFSIHDTCINDNLK